MIRYLLGRAGHLLGRLRLYHGPLRHYGGFVLAGGLAFTTDATILLVLTKLFGVPPLLARPFGISVAMVVSWLVNRTVTFAATSPPSLAEFGRFAAVSWTSQAVNYGIFAAILLAWPATEPVVALILASLVAMFVAYAGFRYGVFERGGRGKWPGEGA